MIKTPTVLIVGAGASAEIGLPTGAQLTNTISKLLNFTFDEWNEKIKSGDRILFEAFRRECREKQADIADYIRASRQISSGMGYAMSIDNYIDIHREDKTLGSCGKAAIARSIIDAEHRSSIYIDESSRVKGFDASSIQKSWYHRLIQLLHTGVPKSQINTIFDNLCIVTFNYDRCIEHFLVNALQPIYGIDADTASDIVKRLKIYHPYGQIGSLPWQDKSRIKIPYGTANAHHHLLDIATELKTFTEEVLAPTNLELIRDAIVNADKIIFIGFGYHEQNIRLIKPLYPVSASRVFGTVMGLSVSNQEAVRSDIKRLCGTAVKIELLNGVCTELFDEYSRSISS